jgi:glutamate-ammonia-ligase adenylyltransferase
MQTLSEILEKDSPPDSDEALLKHAVSCSPFIKRLMEGNSALVDEVLAHMHLPLNGSDMQTRLDSFKITDEIILKKALRKLRQQTLLRLVVRDLNGLADLQEVMQTMTTLAEVTVNAALEHHSNWLEDIYGEPLGLSGKKQTLIVVGMGKLGGGELNVSSDIDLIYAYEEDGETLKLDRDGKKDETKSLSNNDYFTRLSKKLIAALDEITEDGFVFRVDMRLRPYGSEGPLASSFAMLEDYYQKLGREWERYAWIKGRVIAGPAESLSKLLRPFVYRKYLDYSAFTSMRDLKIQIQRDVDRRDLHNNIKLGRGGIREIEFIAQVFQLIRGGQDHTLQIRPTMQVLRLLANKALLDNSVSSELQRAYVFLRNLEHRLQYLNDAQTHDLPETEEGQQLIANSMDESEWSSLNNKLEAVRVFVSAQFSEVFAVQQSAETKVDGDVELLAKLWKGHLDEAQVILILSDLNYTKPDEATAIIASFRTSNKIKRLPDMSGKRLDELMPAVIELCGQCQNSNETLARLISLLETICRRASYLAFFTEYPHVLKRVVTLVSASPWLAGYLNQHPILLDSLLGSNPYVDQSIDEQETVLIAKMHALAGDTEQQMNALREFQQACLFSLACEDVINHIPLQRLSGLLSDLADLVLRVVMKVVWPNIKGKHRDEPNFAIIAYGKHGGRELGYSSDLDLVFLYEDDHPEAREIYVKFGMRIISWLNTITSSGLLYEVDMQLRPDGSSGLLVCSVESFANYQRERAWVWEHQAITRARFAAGSKIVGDAFEKIRIEILMRPRDLQPLRDEITQMRQRMKKAHHYLTGRFDIKHGLGGMIDIEFIVQYLILAYAHSNAKLCENRANIHILRLSSVLGLIPPELGLQAGDAYRELRRQQHAMRLQGYADAWAPEDSLAEQSTVIRKLWRKVFYEPLDNAKS